MIIVDSCKIWFHFDCIMQLKKSYRIATNVCSKKSATTFGDLPDWLVRGRPEGSTMHHHPPPPPPPIPYINL